jgi:hypothetical protein
VVVAQYPAAAVEGVLVECAGLLILAQLAQIGCEPAGRGEGFGVVVAQVGKILEIHQEMPGRIHIVLVRQQVGY